MLNFVCPFEKQMLKPMFRNVYFFLLICLLAPACDKVKNTPAPDKITGLELKPISLNLMANGKTEIDILGSNQFPSGVFIRIKTQPVNGVLTLDEVKKLFVYQPNIGWHGNDKAEYEVCNSTGCKVGELFFQVDSIPSPICTLVSRTDSFSINSEGEKVLALPDTFSCGAVIKELIGNPTPGVVLVGGKIKVNFPKPTLANYVVNYRFCTADNRCETGTIMLNVNITPDPIDPCIERFKPNNDNVQFFLGQISQSINYNLILGNDSACVNDIQPASLVIAKAPIRGVASLRSNRQGKFVRYVKNSDFTSGSDTITYRIEGISGASGTAKIIIKI
jgi:hypothetical protein